MSEMVERVARALMAADCGMDRAGGRAWKAWEPHARAAIEAMRKIDDRTLRAANDGPGKQMAWLTRPMWNRLIDEALK